MQLTGPQYKEIGEALITAFAYESFEQMLQYELTQRLDLIASKNVGFTAVVFETLRWAEREGRVPELIAAAKKTRPDNDNIQALPTSFPSASQADPFIEHHKQIIAELSSTRYQIDRRFVRLTLLLDQGEDFQGIRFIQDPQHNKYDNLRTLLAEIKDRAVVLLGRPGSGKTTLLRRLQLENTWSELENNTGRATFFISLNGYRAIKPGKPPPDPQEWLAHQWRVYHPHLPPFESLLQTGRLLLLLDGLNEMPHRDKTDYRARIGNWQQFLQQTQHYGNIALFSCRSLDYSSPLSSEAVPVRQVNVEPLSPVQIEAYLGLHLGERGAGVWATLRRDEEQLKLFSAPFFLRLLADEVEATGRVPTGQAALLTGFVRRTLNREIERRQPLFMPDELLSEDDVQRVLSRSWRYLTSLPEEGAMIPQLCTLAYRMQDQRRSGEGGHVRLPEPAVREMLTHPRSGDIITAGIQLNVLDKELATREVFFFHQLIQEYFAARVLARTPEPQRVAVSWQIEEVTPSLAETVAGLAISDPLPGLPTTGWEETMVLAAAMATEQERFIRELMAVNLPLAALCAAAPEVPVSPALKAQLQQALITRIGTETADLRARIAAAEALGELGDPRFERKAGLYGDYLLPPLAPIPGGKYTIGDNKSQYDDEKPAGEVEISSFEIGVYPVTNAEYALFIAAGGYTQEKWWATEAAWAWVQGTASNESAIQQGRELQEYVQTFSEETIRAQQASPDQIDFWLWIRNADDEELVAQYEKWYSVGKLIHQPEYWENSRFNHPTQPVVGVSWFEAQAYCAWLSAQTGDRYTLPTEAEWEAAARGKKGRIYAYGREFDAGRCNTFETHIRGTTPVGVFPGGLTPEGIADMSGNVWEWTTTIWGKAIQQPDFPYPYRPGDGREDLTNAAVRRVLRGGSWYFTRGLARAAYRSGYRPGLRNNNDGFRVAARRSPSQVDH